MAIISGIIVDVLVFLIIIGNAILGYKSGLTRVVFNIFSAIIALVLVFILYQPVTNYIIENTSVSESLEIMFEEKIGYLFEKKNINNTEELKNNDDMSSILRVFIGNEIENTIEDTKESIIKYLSVEISHKVIKILIFLILFATIRLLLYILKTYIELITNLPIIRVINGAGGMIYGIVKGFLLVYLIFAVLSLIMPVINDTIIISSIQSAKIGSKMFNNNIILNFILH